MRYEASVSMPVESSSAKFNFVNRGCCLKPADNPKIGSVNCDCCRAQRMVSPKSHEAAGKLPR
jgi:hypothetical protein